MLADPDLAPLVVDQEVNVWLGPGRHIVAYNIVCDRKRCFEHAADSALRTERQETISLSHCTTIRPITLHE